MKFNSSMISEADWTPEQGLTVIFPNGASYNYPAVPFSVWSEMRESASVGGYFSANVKGKYESVRL